MKKCHFSIIPILFLLIGLFIFLYPSIISLGALLPGIESDTNLIHYFLEHGYLFVHQTIPHTSLFDLPIFFPKANTLSFSDMMLGGMLIYVPVRELVDNPQSAYLIWIFAVCILNYISMYLLLSRVFNFKQIPSSVGAVLFAFGLPRATFLTHSQLMLQFYSIFSVFFFLSFNQNKSKIHNNCCLFLGSIFFVIQFYTTFYYGYYMVLGAVICFFIMLLSKNLRIKLFDFVKKYKYELVLYSLFTFTMLIPLLKHYIAVGTQFDYANCGEIRTFPIIAIFVSNSILDNMIFDAGNVFYNIFNIFYFEESDIGIGYIISLLVITGIIKDKINRKYVSAFILIALALFTNTVLNTILYYVFPGTSAIRVSGRIIFLLLPIYSYYLASFITFISSQNSTNKGKLINFVLILLIFAELYTYNDRNWSVDLHRRELEKYPVNNCNVVGFYKNIVNIEDFPADNTDIMWYSISNNVRTINGYSGYQPHFQNNAIPDRCMFELKYK